MRVPGDSRARYIKCIISASAVVGIVLPCSAMSLPLPIR